MRTLRDGNDRYDRQLVDDYFDAVADSVYRPTDGTLLGNLFESLVALTVRDVAVVADARVSHYRDNKGRHEVDFIVSAAGGLVALEAKLGGEVDDDDVRHLLWPRDQVPASGRSSSQGDSGSSANERLCTGSPSVSIMSSSGRPLFSHACWTCS